ncbi:putative MIF4G-like domain superfamily, CCR4-NOT transcription complex subunit 1 [Helianthus annuus]|nr:putative MIF4G-like domain superfamily, CCR4-NOT transcription complex subunit 1 [Helianthus annuus]KAJ0662551.1 putative MIF4G-like domain superfamily, CCR4-NOT transcription complex subunit 1 [Helianthus annuus]KAJ0670071.1 putative MIF4G-like domain superfamily, CCR4-NOT transcription complex subunit 1 [Helianthus annuus]KAJ0856828.1 putative MIF4G-like domain superfamily, CCR4-NOT transcription complex subunit 1 [Helianthus annuus]
MHCINLRIPKLVLVSGDVALLHLTLGIALRLTRRVENVFCMQMFVFGTKALEKFVDRTHPELVAFIERALTRNLSGHPNSDAAAYNPAADQHHNSIPQPNVEVAGSSFSLVGSGGTQLGSQISSPIQLQQRSQSYIDERHRASITSSYMKPNITTTGQASVAPPNDPVIIPKGNQPLPPHSVASSSAALASTPAFARPSRAFTSARFGSALNIETLVAAAERRETPIEMLESCSNSLAYQPPNPWTMGVLALLAEIYAMPNLKMNLKFEIEEVTPSSHLIDKVREIEGNPDFSNKDVGTAQQPIVGEVKSNMISTLNQVELPVEVGCSSHSAFLLVIRYVAPHYIPAVSLSEDEKMATLGLSDKLPSAQGLLQSQLPFSVGQRVGVYAQCWCLSVGRYIWWCMHIYHLWNDERNTSVRVSL